MDLSRGGVEFDTRGTCRGHRKGGLWSKKVRVLDACRNGKPWGGASVQVRPTAQFQRMS